MTVPQDPPIAPTPDAVSTAVEAVFRDPALQEGLGAGPDPFFGQVLARLWALILDWLRSIQNLRSDSPGLFWLLLTVLLLTLALLVWHIVYTLRRAFRAPAGAAARAGSGHRAQRVARSSELRDRARALAREGEYRDAARHLVLALLALLDERRIVHAAQGWTNREILARVAARCGKSEEMAAFGGTVERSSYGGVALGDEGFARLDAAFEELRDRLDEAAV